MVSVLDENGMRITQRHQNWIALSEGQEIPAEFSRPEVLEILRDYYAGLSEEENGESSTSALQLESEIFRSEE